MTYPSETYRKTMSSDLADSVAQLARQLARQAQDMGVPTADAIPNLSGWILRDRRINKGEDEREWYLTDELLVLDTQGVLYNVRKETTEYSFNHRLNKTEYTACPANYESWDKSYYQQNTQDGHHFLFAGDYKYPSYAAAVREALQTFQTNIDSHGFRSATPVSTPIASGPYTERRPGAGQRLTRNSASTVSTVIGTGIIAICLGTAGYLLGLILAWIATLFLGDQTWIWVLFCGAGVLIGAGIPLSAGLSSIKETWSRSP